ncbi:hypothetical protein ACP4OV_014033 [Aristida adscensionis]
MAAESMEMEMEVEGGPSPAALPGGDGLSQDGNFQWSIRRCDAVSDYSSSSINTSALVRDGGHTFNPDAIPAGVRELVFLFGHGDATAVERCLSQLGTLQVIHITSFAGVQSLTESMWGTALTNTVKSIMHAVEDYDDGDASENDKERETSFEDYHLFFARFIEADVLKMLPFINAIRSVRTTDIIGVYGDRWEVLVLGKLRVLLDLTYPMEQARDAISILRSHSSLDLDTKSIDEAVEIFKEAIFHTFDEIKSGIMSSNDSSNDVKFYWSSEIITRCIKCIIASDYHLSLSVLLEKAHKVCMNTTLDEARLPRLLVDIVSCLEQKLAEISQSFTDPGRGLLFLLNNTYYICDQLYYKPASFLTSTQLPQKIEDHIQNYLRLSWEPVLSCLHKTTPLLCLTSPLVKFESEFNKVYNDQKLWKVLDPNLRRKLRKAIIEKVTSGLTKYLEDNNITTPSVTPQALEEMLKELFEGRTSKSRQVATGTTVCFHCSVFRFVREIKCCASNDLNSEGSSESDKRQK